MTCPYPPTYFEGEYLFGPPGDRRLVRLERSPQYDDNKPWFAVYPAGWQTPMCFMPPASLASMQTERVGGQHEQLRHAR